MDYELRIVVEKVAISSQEVIKRDTITSYALQCPTSIVELGLRHAEQIALLEQVQNSVLAEQSRLLAPGMPGCPTCGNTLKKNGYKTSKFHAVFSDHTVRIQKHHCRHPDCGWHSTPTITSLFGTNIHPDLATLQCAQGALYSYREAKKNLDVHFITSLPVMQQHACMVWADTRPVQSVWAVRLTKPDHDVVDDAFG